MKIIFVILFCITAGFAYSQKIIELTSPQNINDDYHLLNSSDTAFVETGHSDDMGTTYGQFYSLKANVPDGEYLFYLEGAPVLRAFIKNFQKDSVWTDYFSTGSPKSVVPYKNGLMNGDALFYYYSGSVYRIIKYVNNQIEGPSITFYETGKIKYISFYENNDCIKQEVYDRNGDMIDDMIDVVTPPNINKYKFESGN